ncbi:hypothetical protein B7C51_00320 [Paenibacillus larvae subsp. pulvifaciens]|uniref:Uncharacterized protein n=1 Tax=Paenibacillus larvae subsp. pulvifaciens TaxID=1477 RepID=A0A1V0UMS7_9BACL|nr:hypothetical protein B7C51_00320 [Paenibacillus larvae subsp. pulvifaciens]
MAFQAIGRDNAKRHLILWYFPLKVDRLKKGETLSQHRQENIYLTIQGVQQEESFSIQLLCEIAKIPILQLRVTTNQISLSPMESRTKSV